MNTSGDAAEQIVRLSLEGAEVVLKLTGSAAKNLAAMLYAISKDPKYPKAGKAKIASMLKTQKPMTAYTIKQSDCAEFCKRAKEYGITYCPIAYKKTDGTIDVLIFESDAARVNRIVERFKLSTVDAASIKAEIQQSREEQNAPVAPGAAEAPAQEADSQAPAVPEQGQPTKSQEDILLDEMLGAPIKKEEPAPSNPTAARTEKSPPSEPTSEKPSRAAEGTVKKQERPSVRGELREIQSRRRQEEATVTPTQEKTPAKSQRPANTQTQHRQPSKKKKKPKSKAR